MRRPRFPRILGPVLIATIALAACTSASQEPGTGAVTRTVPPPTSATTAATTPTPTASSSVGSLDLAAEQVTIRPPRGGNVRVHGRYPFAPSRCVRPDRPTLDGRYPGTLSIRVAGDRTITVGATITFQEYLEGIAEVPPTWPTAALEAQVIAARSYVLSRTGWTGEEGADLDTPICGTSECQVYGGIPEPRPPGLRRWYRAVRDTRGQVLLTGDRPADTVYFSTSNGKTYGNEDVFGSSALPYLRPVIEHDDGASPLSRWRVAVPFGDLATMLRAAGSWPAGAPIASASVAGSSVRLAGGGESRTLDAGQIRDAANAWGPCLLPRRYPSDGLPVTVPSGWFGLSANRHELVIDGRGWGHGVGMVQWGAYGKARKGWSASRILAFYYGGLTPRTIPEPGTMKVVIATGLTSLTLDPSHAGGTIDGAPLPEGNLRIVASGGELAVMSAR